MDDSAHHQVLDSKDGSWAIISTGGTSSSSFRSSDLRGHVAFTLWLSSAMAVSAGPNSIYLLYYPRAEDGPRQSAWAYPQRLARCRGVGACSYRVLPCRRGEMLLAGHGPSAWPWPTAVAGEAALQTG